MVEPEVVEQEATPHVAEASAPEEPATEIPAKPEIKKSFVDKFLEKLDKMMY